jgi:hypothetical protein
MSITPFIHQVAAVTGAAVESWGVLLNAIIRVIDESEFVSHLDSGKSWLLRGLGLQARRKVTEPNIESWSYHDTYLVSKGIDAVELSTFDGWRDSAIRLVDLDVLGTDQLPTSNNFRIFFGESWSDELERHPGLEHEGTRLIDWVERTPVYRISCAFGSTKTFRMDPELLEVYGMASEHPWYDFGAKVVRVHYVVSECSNGEKRKRHVEFKKQSQIQLQRWPAAPVAVPIGPVLGFESERIRRLDGGLVVIGAPSIGFDSIPEVSHGSVRSFKRQLQSVHRAPGARAVGARQGPLAEQGWKGVLHRHRAQDTS